MREQTGGSHHEQSSLDADTVRDAHDVLVEACWTPDDVAEWLAALARLVAAAERTAELGPKVSCDFHTGQGTNCGTCNDCLQVNLHFVKQAFKAAEAERDAALAKVEQLETALRECPCLYDLQAGDCRKNSPDKCVRCAALGGPDA